MTVAALLLADLGGDAGGRSLLSRSVDALRGLHAVGRILVAMPPGADPPRGSRAVAGGRDLVTTVEGALEEAGRSSILLVHDPCRSLVETAVFSRALEDLREHRCDAVVAAAPATDTLKRVDADGRIIETVDRSQMWEIRTPQAYRVEALEAAITRARDRSLRHRLLAGDHGLLPSCVDGRVRIVQLER